MPKRNAQLVIDYTVEDDIVVCVGYKLFGEKGFDNVLSVMLSAIGMECDRLNRGINDGTIQTPDGGKMLKLVSDFINYYYAEDNCEKK